MNFEKMRMQTKLPEGNAGQIIKPAVKPTEEANSFTLFTAQKQGFFCSRNILEASYQ